MDWNKIKMDKISIEVDKYFFATFIQKKVSNCCKINFSFKNEKYYIVFLHSM